MRGLPVARGWLLPAALVVLLTGVACPVGPGVTGRVEVAPAGAPAVELTYLGVGGWIMEWRGTQVLAAPLFSNPAFTRTGVLSIRSDTAVVDRWMAPYDVSEAAAILGSRTVKNLLGTWSGVSDRVVLVDSLAGNLERVGGWIPLGDAVRVMPLDSHHAPHFQGVTLYSGTADVPRHEEPATADEWLDGPSYAFLVDFLHPDGSVALRLYYQDAVPAAPAGLAPEALMAERPVDAAILVPATFDQVDWFPEAFIENLTPRWVLLGHWENFFRRPESRTRSIRYSDVRYFEDRLARAFDGESWLPELFTEFRFPVEPAP